MDRRKFLATSMAVAGFAAFRSSIAADWLEYQQSSVARFDRGFAAVQEIASGVYATIANSSKGPQCISNGGVIAGKKATLIIEGHFQPAGAELEIELARAMSKAPIRAAVDTHYHLDHSFGNGAYADEKIPIIAHERVAPMMKERYAARQSADPKERLAPFERKLAATIDEREKQRRQSDLSAETWMADSIRTARLVYPTKTLPAAGMHIDLGGMTAVLEAHPAHSPTDVIIRVPEREMVFTGDLLFNGMYPVCIDADMRAHGKVLDLFASYPKTTKFVPGHGAVCGRDTVMEQRDLVNDLQSHAESMMRAGASIEEAVERYMVPKRFENFAIFSWSWCVGAALRSFYGQRGDVKSSREERAATMLA